MAGDDNPAVGDPAILQAVWRPRPRGHTHHMSSVSAPAPVAEARTRVRRSADDGWLDGLGRAGMATRGLLYAVVAWLAIEVAHGDGRRADSKGALATIAHQPLGRVLLVVVAVGLVAMAAWTVASVVLKDGAGRFSRIGRLCVYLSLFTVAVSLILSGRGGGNDKEADITARVLRLPAGPWLVGLVGIGIVVAGTAQVRKMFGRRWAKAVQLEKVPPRGRGAVGAVAATGIAARAVVFVLIGAFLVRAAVRYNPGEATGVDGALKRLAAASHGPALLTAVAVGFLAYGMWCAVIARYGPRPGA
jgi:hypothetical protein